MAATSTANGESLAIQLASYESLVLDVKDEVRGHCCTFLPWGEYDDTAVSAYLFIFLGRSLLQHHTITYTHCNGVTFVFVRVWHIYAACPSTPLPPPALPSTKRGHPQGQHPRLSPLQTQSPMHMHNMHVCILSNGSVSRISL